MAERVDVLTDVQGNLSDKCLVLLEEVITSNRKLAEENGRSTEETAKLMLKSSNGLSSGWRAKEMLKREMVLEDVSIVEDRPHELWYQCM